MKVLIVGAGVIGTVYGAHLAAAGNTVSVLSHGVRTDEVAAGGLSVRDVLGGGLARAETAVVPYASGDYDVVLVAVRRDQLASACAGLTGLAGKPAVVFFGNNPAGRSAISGEIPGDTYLGFPGVGGVMTGGTADYVRIRQQPTALPQASDPRLAALEAALADRGFAVQRVADMDGWLAYHAAFIACIAAALFRCGIDPVRLAGDRATLTLMLCPGRRRKRVMAQKGQEPARRNFSHRDLSRRTDYPHVNSALTEESVMGIRILPGCGAKPCMSLSLLKHVT